MAASHEPGWTLWNTGRSRAPPSVPRNPGRGEEPGLRAVRLPIRAAQQLSTRSQRLKLKLRGRFHLPEPSNVVAGGGACPLRFRCVGCDHYSTDISYLP